MKIACLQFAPQVGDVDNNLNRADSILSRANPQDLDLLVLPELAFSGYNFRSLQHISPFLEPTTAGISSLWARTTALKYDCTVVVGYPEKVDVTPKWPASPEYYNAAIMVNREGETVTNYRKSFLYYTDETWALEGPGGFYSGEVQGFGNVAMGICMDMNPYKFEAPWNAWEFSYHVLHNEANLVILSMAWLTREDARSFSRTPNEPDMETLSYWLARLEPLIRAEAEGEIIVVLANRCGTEEDAVYAGTSTVLGICDGEVKVYGILGRGEKELLVVDTSVRPQAKLISQPNSAASTATASTTQTNDSEASTDTGFTSPDMDETFPEFEDNFSPVSPVRLKHAGSPFSAEGRRDEIETASASVSTRHLNRDHSPSTIPNDTKVSNSPLKSDNATQEPRDSTSPELKSPRVTASALPGSNAAGDSLGPRSRHVSPRPKSSFW